MPKTSVCCHRGPDPMRSGFTLLEMLLVLVLLALATSLVAPNLVGRLQASEDRGLEEAVEDLLASLPARARQEQQPATWSAERLQAALSVRSGEFSEAMRLQLTQPLNYDARGLAQGGEVRLLKGERLLAVWTIEPHLGRPQKREGAVGDAG